MGNKVNKIKYSRRKRRKEYIKTALRMQLKRWVNVATNAAADDQPKTTVESTEVPSEVSTEIFIPPTEPTAITMTETEPKKEVVEEEIPPQHQEDVECRACLQRFDYEAGLLDMFQAWEPPWNGMGQSIAQDYAQIANVEITATDSYSKLICQFCYQKLLDACSFVVNVRINDRLLRQRAETLHEQGDTWPKPIQVDKNINSNVFNTAMDVEIKQEVLSEDESYPNCVDDSFKDGAEGPEGADNAFNNLEIKIEPEEIIQPAPYQIMVNEPSTSATKKTKRGPKTAPVNEYIAHLAVNDVLKGKSVRSTAKAYGISSQKLYKHLKEAKSATEDIVPTIRHPHVFSEAQELELIEYLMIARKLCHGLTPTIVRQFAYQYANGNINTYSASWAVSEAATYDWFYKFMNRHKELTMKSPKGTSLPRDNRNVGNFFENLKSLLEQYEFRPEQIWNIDETAITTFYKPNESLIRKVLKQPAKLTSGETVCVCGAINAAGGSMPPFIVYPRKVWQVKLTEGGLPGTEGAAHPSGCMTGGNFLIFLKLFVRHVRCSKNSPCLIILDSHESHVTIDTISFCRDSGIELLTTPPYTSQKLQPLSPIFMHLKMYYSLACDDWMGRHLGDSLTTDNFAECLGKASQNVMTASNIQKSFADIGICPFNPGVLTDEFLSSEIEIQDVKSLAQNEDATVTQHASLYIIPNVSNESTTPTAAVSAKNDDISYTKLSDNKTVKGKNE